MCNDDPEILHGDIVILNLIKKGLSKNKVCKAIKQKHYEMLKEDFKEIEAADFNKKFVPLEITPLCCKPKTKYNGSNSMASRCPFLEDIMPAYEHDDIEILNDKTGKYKNGLCYLQKERRKKYGKIYLSFKSRKTFLEKLNKKF